MSQGCCSCLRVVVFDLGSASICGSSQLASSLHGLEFPIHWLCPKITTANKLDREEHSPVVGERHTERQSSAQSIQSRCGVASACRSEFLLGTNIGNMVRGQRQIWRNTFYPGGVCLKAAQAGPWRFRVGGVMGCGGGGARLDRTKSHILGLPLTWPRLESGSPFFHRVSDLDVFVFAQNR